ncbi:MAG: hypothetical protein MK125_02845, partial [Dehalococcoidia bacterium]|nr:hypothetical protein [Dehalococcoidia bacterium]
DYLPIQKSIMDKSMTLAYNSGAGRPLRDNIRLLTQLLRQPVHLKLSTMVCQTEQWPMIQFI